MNMTRIFRVAIVLLIFYQYRTEDSEGSENVDLVEDNDGTENGDLKPYDLPVQWVEERDKETGESIDMDIFFDRTVMIGLELSPNEQAQVISTGVLIDSEHVLTSYNPLRKLLNNTDNLIIAVLTGRRYNKSEHEYIRKIQYFTFVCFQQIVELPEEMLSAQQWHGEDKLHSPLHDLLVIRMNKNLTLLNPDPPHSFEGISETEFTEVGPLVTELAKSDSWLGQDVKFASLGFRDKEHMLSYNMLSSKSYVEEDNAIVDCDEWMLRDWGRFICVLNVDMYEGVGSGALLIHKNELYGIGSYTLKKGNTSILVFTDVRPYYPVMFKICVDQNENETIAARDDESTTGATYVNTTYMI